MMADLRKALLAERGVRFAVLFGSMARGDEDQGSDVDLLVDLTGDEPMRVTSLMTRLRPVVGREVDIALLDRVQENAPLLLSRVLDEGQVIVDRDGVWADLQRQRHTIDAEAERSYRQQMKEAAKAIENLTARQGTRVSRERSTRLGPLAYLCQDPRVADRSIADQLRDLGVKNGDVLVKMAEAGQLLALKCEMPQCYHHKGRGAFDPLTPARTMWAPSRDHYPILKSAGGKLVPANVRLSHTECNQRDYNRRKQIGTLLAKDKSLEEIAETLNRKDVPPAHGTNCWTAAMVRKAYVT